LFENLFSFTIQQSVLRLANHQTPLKTRAVVGQQQLLRMDYEKVQPLSVADEDALLAKIAAVLPSQQVVLLSDYGLGLLSQRLCQAVIALAKQANKPVLVDPRQPDFSIFAGANLIKPNRLDLSNALKQLPKSAVDPNASVDAQAELVRQAYGFDHLLVTLGADGMTLCQQDQPSLHLPAYQREVFDVSGAGDTVLAVLAAAIAVGASYEQAASLANLASSLVVAKRGTAVVNPGELLAAISDLRGEATRSKIGTLEQIDELVKTWREQGQRVVLTNGCFDLLHPGHIASIANARLQGDRLVVAVNSDASVKRLKGESRPIQSEDARASVLAALQDVDAVVIFGDDAPLEVLQTLKPAVYCKGSDYQNKNIAEFDLVRGYGGKIHLIPLVDGFSTTKTVQRLSA
jgi:D-beta-D-heptose 7-phosphate kinase/D-beta-D-heptose 1-phosphate adenosyltransferase